MDQVSVISAMGRLQDGPPRQHACQVPPARFCAVHLLGFVRMEGQDPAARRIKDTTSRRYFERIYDFLARMLRNRAELPVYTAEDPLTAVVRGTGKVLEKLEQYEKVLS